MLEHFSLAARRVVVVADEEARLLGHDAVGTGHLLLGLLVVDDDGFTANLLWGCDLTVDLVRTKVAELTRHRPPEAAASTELTDEAKRSIELALRAAMEHGRPVGTDHLLLGVIELGEGVAIRTLEAFAIDLANLKAAVVTTQGMARSPEPSVAPGDRDEEAGLADAVKTGAAAGRQLAENLTAARRVELQQQVAAGEEAWQTALTRYTPLVENVATRYRQAGVPMSDLVVAGCHGLHRAMEKFDARRGAKFSTYATWWIRQAITTRIAG